MHFTSVLSAINIVRKAYIVEKLAKLNLQLVFGACQLILLLKLYHNF